jgi:hypothetical protein
MTADTIGTNSRAVFDAELPVSAYEQAQAPDEASRPVRQGRVTGYAR